MRAKAKRPGEVRPEIEKLLLEMRRDLRELKGHGAPQRTGKAPLFRDYAEEWFERYCRERRKRKPGTLTHRAKCVRVYLVPPLRRRRMDDFGSSAIDVARDHLKDYADSTRNGALVVLGMILRSAHEDGWLKKLPRIELETIIRTKRRVYDSRTYLAVIRAARRLGWRHHLAVLLAGDAGLRRSEIAGLEWVCVRLDERLIDVAAQAKLANVLELPKSNRPRAVILTDQLFRALTRAKKVAKSSRVVPGARGRPIGGGAIYHLVTRSVAAAGIESLEGPHFFRHLWATHLVDSGASVRAIQLMCGHQSMATTEKYLSENLESLHSAIALLDAKRSAAKK